MLGENKNLKDSTLGEGLSLRDNKVFISYSKTNKLITALYMVTDVLEENEPIRHKLRTLGIDIISDMSTASVSSFVFNNTVITDTTIKLTKKVQEIISLLEIVFSLGMISEMNFSILKKEFIRFKESIGESKKDTNLLDFLKDEEEVRGNVFERIGPFKGHDIGHKTTRIGVQKGGTLLKALSDKMSNRTSLKINNVLYKDNNTHNNFNLLKDKRREEIISIIKDKKIGNLNFDGVNIKDILLAVRGLGEEWGEKTLQRELSSMVLDGILEKAGEKRWSRYLLK